VASRGGRDEPPALLPVPRWLIGLMDQTLSVLRLQYEGRFELWLVRCLYPKPYNVRCAPRIRRATTCLNAGSPEDLVVTLAEPRAAL
jgi:hypothetical protein